MHHTHINANNLDEAHYLSIERLLNTEYGVHEYEVTKGSGEDMWTRREFDSYSLHVEYPNQRPLEPIMPTGIAPPTDREYVRQYKATKILGDKREKNETYTYGYFILREIERIIKMLIDTPETNHAYIRIGGLIPGECTDCDGKGYWLQRRQKPDRTFDMDNPIQMQCEKCAGTGEDWEFATDVDRLNDPPCLRHIQWRVIDGKLHEILFFRSWDLWAGFPSNLAALQLLNEEIATGTGYSPGTLTAYSCGLHLYDTSLEVAKNRLSAGR